MKVTQPGLKVSENVYLIRNAGFFDMGEAEPFGPILRYLKINGAVTKIEPAEPVECGESGTAIPGTAYLAMPVGGGRPTNVRIDKWPLQYEEHPSQPGVWLPKGEKRAVLVPEGVTAILITADKGDDGEPLIQIATYPHSIAIGNGGEVWTYTDEFIRRDLIPIT
jgi:hypothetical protein